MGGKYALAYVIGSSNPALDLCNTAVPWCCRKEKRFSHDRIILFFEPDDRSEVLGFG